MTSISGSRAPETASRLSKIMAGTPVTPISWASLIFPFDQLDILIALQHIGDLGTVHAANVRNVGQDADIADILAILEIGDEQPLHHFVLDAGRFRPADQAMGIQGIGRPRMAAKSNSMPSLAPSAAISLCFLDAMGSRRIWPRR